MSKKHTPAGEIDKEVAAIHQEHATKTVAEAKAINPDAKVEIAPLTGVEVAAKLAAKQPAPEAPGARYSLKDRANVDAAAVTVTSPDGSIEDAVRVFNSGRKEIRTAKQLIIEKVAA